MIIKLFEKSPKMDDFEDFKRNLTDGYKIEIGKQNERINLLESKVSVLQMSTAFRKKPE